ncbi:MAG: NAD(P)-dependent oxidoreductase, partial [Bacteroidota bacterium]
MDSTVIDKQAAVEKNVSTNHLFPVFLKLEELKVLLVGGGNVALEKLNAIVANAPATAVHIVSIEVSPEIKELAAQFPNITIVE